MVALRFLVFFNVVAWDSGSTGNGSGMGLVAESASDSGMTVFVFNFAPSLFTPLLSSGIGFGGFMDTKLGARPVIRCRG